MVRALGRPALPVLFLLGLFAARGDGGPISVAEIPADGSSTFNGTSNSPPYGNVVVRITSTPARANNPLADFGASSQPPPDWDLYGFGSGSALLPPAVGSQAIITGAWQPPGSDWRLAGSSIRNVGGKSIDIQYFVPHNEWFVPQGQGFVPESQGFVAANVPAEADDASQMALNPEPGAFILFGIGVVAACAWRVRRQPPCG